MLRVAGFIVALFLVPATNAKDLSLAEIQSQLIGQEVIIIGKELKGYGPTGDSLMGWYRVEGDETSGFKQARYPSDQVPTSIRGKRGSIIAVVHSPAGSGIQKAGDTDVFGKPIDASRIMNPYVLVVVRMPDDGALIGAKNYFNNFGLMNFQIASQADTRKVEIERSLDSLVGKTLYKAGYTELLKANLSLKELVDRIRRAASKDYQTPNLTALTVVDAKFLETENAVVLKVDLPSGEQRLLFGDLTFYHLQNNAIRTPLERLRITAAETIPKFSAREIAAIKEGKIFLGMSEDALFWSWGYPEKTNDWGRGGTQQIYGSQYVYVEKAAVRDWQSLSK